MTGHIHITPLGGIAGDMFVAGMLDAFPELSEPVLSATALLLPGANAVLESKSNGGIAARRFSVPDQGRPAPLHFPDLDRMLADSGLAEPAERAARAMLLRLAEAEAAVHGVPLERVHFHEIADWDTLADLAAAGCILAALQGWSWSLDPLPLGGGRVRTAHGMLPVPAPATAHLLQGMAVVDDGIAGERVTPTGAVILRHIAEHLTLTPRPMGRLQATGYGAGTRELKGLPNVVVVQVISGVAQTGDWVAVLEWDIDDMTGEEIGVASDHLRATDGVLDLVTWPMAGKKGRVSTAFRMLTKPSHVDVAQQAVFAQTTTLGLRLRRDQRTILPRSTGPGVKRAVRPYAITAKADSDLLSQEDTLATRRALAHEIEG